MNGSVPYMDPGVDQVDVAMRPRNYRQGSRADVPERRGCQVAARMQLLAQESGWLIFTLICTVAFWRLASGEISLMKPSYLRSGNASVVTAPCCKACSCSRAAWLDLVDFLRGGSCRDHTWPCVHISSPARGHLVALWVSRGGDNWSCKCLGLMSRTVLNSLLRVFPLKPLIASTEG